MSSYPPPPQQGQPYEQPYPQQYGGRSSRRVIRRIDVFSAAKVTAVASALIVAVFGLFFVLLAFCGLLNALTNNGAGSGVAGGALLIFYVFAIAIYGVLGFIVGALYAWVYNMTSSWIGGLEVDVE